MIRDLFSCLRHGTFGEKLFALLMLALIASVAGILCYVVFIVADSWWLTDSSGTARVNGRCYTPEHFQTIWHSNGNGGGWTQVIYVPPSWELVMESGGKSDGFGVSEFQFNTVPDGTEARITYRCGRFSDWLYITSAEFP